MQVVHELHCVQDWINEFLITYTNSAYTRTPILPLSSHTHKHPHFFFTPYTHTPTSINAHSHIHFSHTHIHTHDTAAPLEDREAAHEAAARDRAATPEPADAAAETAGRVRHRRSTGLSEIAK